MYEEHSDECMDDTRNYEYMDEEHSDEYMDDRHEQSECYTCKQYECNEYVRSALARSNTI
jgi:hypothetical protein